MGYQYIELTENSPKRKILIKADKKFFKLIGVYADGYRHHVDQLVNTEGRIFMTSGDNGSSVTEYSSFANGSINSTGFRSYLQLDCRYSNRAGSYVEVGVENFELIGITLTIICDIDESIEEIVYLELPKEEEKLKIIELYMQYATLDSANQYAPYYFVGLYHFEEYYKRYN